MPMHVLESRQREPAGRRLIATQERKHPHPPDTPERDPAALPQDTEPPHVPPTEQQAILSRQPRAPTATGVPCAIVHTALLSGLRSPLREPGPVRMLRPPGPRRDLVQVHATR